jgi:heme A synthase
MTNKGEGEYLPEDKDLLDEVEGVGPSTSGVAETDKMHSLTVIQIKAALRSRKTAHDLDRSTSKYSLVLILFALVQVIIGIVQFVFDAEYSSHAAVGVLYILAIGVLCFFLFKDAFKILDK